MNTAALSDAGLRRLHDVLSRHAGKGTVPGAVALVSRHGETHVETVGITAVGGDAPMRPDTIFRLASITKPITAVAAMILIEECVLRLDDPVDELLPELADRRVLTDIEGPVTDTVPAHRPITPRDLLTHRMGFGLHFTPAPILDAITELGIVGFGGPRPDTPHTPDEWIRLLGTLPLMHQPGERWLYNTSSYVLGVLIARASGQPLETFLRERIFAPLNMVDTGFSVPPGDLDRLATSYAPDTDTGELRTLDTPEDSRWATPPTFPDAGGGLVSTVEDLATFGQMMLGNGKHGNERILSRPSVQLMTTDHLTPAHKAVSGFLPGYFDSRGWGFGMAVTTRRDTVASVPGQFGWDGGSGTSWWADPTEDMQAILLTQREAFPLFSEIYQDFWTSTYQALGD